MTSRMRLRRASSTVSRGSRLTMPAMPHMVSLAFPPRPSAPPRPVPEAGEVLGHDKQQVDLGATQRASPRWIPPIGTLAKNRLAGQETQRAEQSSVEPVVMRGAQISVRAVPAPHAAVIPDVER